MLKVSVDDFRSKDTYLEFLKTRSREIRDQIEAVRSEQRNWFVVNTIFSGLFSFVGVSAKSQGLQSGMFVASALSGIAALISAYNCQQLTELLQRLERSGYLV